jgi:hypothetical protein
VRGAKCRHATRRGGPAGGGLTVQVQPTRVGRSRVGRGAVATMIAEGVPPERRQLNSCTSPSEDRSGTTSEGFHGTTALAAKSILASGFIRSSGGSSAPVCTGVTTSRRLEGTEMALC